MSTEEEWYKNKAEVSNIKQQLTWGGRYIYMTQNYIHAFPVLSTRRLCSLKRHNEDEVRSGLS